MHSFGLFQITVCQLYSNSNQNNEYLTATYCTTLNSNILKGDNDADSAIWPRVSLPCFTFSMLCSGPFGFFLISGSSINVFNVLLTQVIPLNFPYSLCLRFGVLLGIAKNLTHRLRNPNPTFSLYRSSPCVTSEQPHGMK